MVSIVRIVSMFILSVKKSDEIWIEIDEKTLLTDAIHIDSNVVMFVMKIDRRLFMCPFSAVEARLTSIQKVMGSNPIMGMATFFCSN